MIMNVLLFIWQRRWQWLDFIAASFDEEERQIAKQFDEHSACAQCRHLYSVLALQGSTEGGAALMPRGVGVIIIVA